MYICICICTCIYIYIYIYILYSHTHTAQQAALFVGHRQVWAGTAARHSIDAMGHRKAGAAPPTKHSEQEKVLRKCFGAFNGTAMISHCNNRITTLVTCVSNMSLQLHLKPNLASDRYWDRAIVVAARLQRNRIGMSMKYQWHCNKPLTVLWQLPCQYNDVLLLQVHCKSLAIVQL